MSSDENEGRESGNGILMYDLAGNWCEECGRPKMNRLLGALTGCPACDEVITRHRCTSRPRIEDLPDGQSWECPDCGSRWTVVSAEEGCPDCCGECGHRITVRRWDVTEGDRIATAPQYEPQPFSLFRNPFSALADEERDRLEWIGEVKERLGLVTSEEGSQAQIISHTETEISES